MSKYVVLSLYTDGEGSRRNEFSALLQELTNTSSVPMYVAIDPDPAGDRILGMFDYNQAVDSSFAKKLDKSHRRFLRNERRRKALAGGAR